MVRVAVVGCTHGQLDAIYDHVKKVNRSTTAPTDKVRLIICCGDFESLRNAHDLSCKACPPKYRHMNNFPEYYTGKKKAPILTVFIGGNHEASNYLRELFYGGWVAPNIFYLGAAGVMNVAGLRIAGLSGIYGSKYYHRGFFEKEPYSKKAIDSLVMVREAQIFQLAHLQRGRRLDAILSHDWPRKIEDYGDRDALLAQRPDFQASIDEDRFGSVGSERLLAELKPAKWLAGHMHVRFEATVPHSDTDETTHFLGLSKCDPGVACVEIVDIPTPSADEAPSRGDVPRIMMDVEWLAILKKTHDVVTTTLDPITMPTELVPVTEGDLEDVRRCIAKDFSARNRRRKGLIEGEWITEFVPTAPVEGGGEASATPLLNLGSPQTDELLAMLELPHTVTVPYKATAVRQASRQSKARK